MRWLFSIIYRRWLWNDFHGCHDRIVRVKGWRTMLTETRSGTRQTITPIFLK